MTSIRRQSAERAASRARRLRRHGREMRKRNLLSQAFTKARVQRKIAASRRTHMLQVAEARKRAGAAREKARSAAQKSRERAGRTRDRI